MQVRLLGQFDVRANGARIIIRSRSAQSLFAFLAINAGQLYRREHLIALLWSDLPEPRARRHLRQALWHIRSAFALHHVPIASILVADEFTLSLDSTTALWIDTVQFERHAGNNTSLASILTRASLYRGELLPGFYEDWITPERERFAALYEATMCDLLKQLVELEDWHCVIEWAETWLSISHSAEPAFCALMLAYSALHDPAKIPETYARCRTALAELDVTPSDETIALYTHLNESLHHTAVGSVRSILSNHTPRPHKHGSRPIH